MSGRDPPLFDVSALVLHRFFLISSWITGVSYQPKNPASSSGAEMIAFTLLFWTARSKAGNKSSSNTLAHLI